MVRERLWGVDWMPVGDELPSMHTIIDLRRVKAAGFAAAAAAVLFIVLMFNGGGAGAGMVSAQTDPTPTQVVDGPVVVWETAIPEDWPEGQTSHIIISFEAYSADGGALTFDFKESDDTAKFSLIPAGLNDGGNYVAHLVLKEGEELDYETQSTYLIGVVVSAADEASTEILLRLRIIDVDEDVASPSPTASASPTPSATPIDPCFEVISEDVNIDRSWSDSCLSENRPNNRRTGDYYARFFAFTITEAATVGIRLESEVDTYLYLMEGTEKDGEVVAENDDAVPGVDFNSEIVGTELEAGEYTIEATTYGVEESGEFTLKVTGLPEPPLDCTTGGAVVDAGDNPELTSDCDTLLSLRDLLAGSVVLNWAADTPIADWDGVTVGGSPMRVTELALDEKGLDGSLPAQLGLLTGMEVLSLSGNNLSGALPSELGNLGALRDLSVDRNQLTGEIPAELGGLAELERLVLNGNQIGGILPTELGDLANLVELKVSGNSLVGCIPLALQSVADHDLADTGLSVCGADVCRDGSVVAEPNENEGLVADCETLLGLRDALAGSATLNWGANNAIRDWDGVTMAGSPMRVTGLELDEMELTGSVPAELGALTGLEVMSLSGNRLRGTIPAELGGLSNLTRLSLDNNLLTGDIPVELGDLSELESLALNDNMLSGAIPAELANLAKLKSLLLANNRLSGEIPVELADLDSLEELKLAGNSLSGCIPPALEDVAVNDLSETGLEACASGVCTSGNAVDSPDENAGLVADCNALIASRSRLGGRVSLNWSVNVPIEHWEGVKVGGSPKRVIHLVLNERGLSGRLPAELSRLSHLSLLQITGNEISGGIPAELGSLSRLQLMVLANNDLSGEIPPELDGLSSLSHMSLTGNQLSGEIPPELSSLSNLSSLYLDDNRLSGELPKEFGSLPNLRFLYLDDNDLSGMIPPELGESRTLEVLSIDGNRLTGPIPSQLGAIATLEHLSLESNMLRGTIPVELGSLTNLEILSLAANRLTGEIPAQLGAIPNLRTLSLHSNEFTGCIPKELQDVQRNDLISLGLEFCGEGQCAGGTAVTNPNANHGLVSDCNSLLAGLDGLRGAAALNWTTELAIENWQGLTISGSPRRITEVNLDNVGLDGEIPAEVRNLTYLKVLNLSDNSLTGEIPSELARLSILEVLSLNDNQLSGQIPHDLTRLDNLTELNLSGGNSFSGCIPDGLDDITDNDLDALVNLPLCGEVDCSSGTAVEDPDGNQDLVSDCETLMGLRDELAGRAFLNWTVHLSMDDWDGVTVRGSIKRATHIELKGKGLSGEIPAELARLEALEVLVLSDNELVGRIPSELGKLTFLKRLLLDGNLLNGEISPELGVLSDLEELKLAGNNLSGCVPKAFEDIMTNDREELGLDFCEVGECSNGTAVEDPDDNPGLLTDCDALLAVRDKLRGGILNWSADVAIDEWYGVTVEGSPKRVTQLKIGPSRLDGEIPVELGRLSKLKVLSLADNRLSGGIPSELGDLYELEELSLSKNRLDGAIPSQLGNLTSLERLSLSDNRLSGGMPPELGQLLNLDHLSLSNNRLTGEIPAEFGMLTELTYLSLTNNRVTGAIPAEIGNLTELRYLRLSDNSLSGAIPSELGGLVQLRHLHLSRNQLSGAIPAELGSLSSLTLLHLSDNDLTGMIPTELGGLSNLTELYLSRNGLTGEIPSELGSLAKLVQLYLPRNELTGEIPSELDNLENLTFLFLGGNQLTGCVPVGLKDVANNDLSQLNLPDCEAETSMFLDPRESHGGLEGGPGGASNAPIYLDGLVGLRRPL